MTIDERVREVVDEYLARARQDLDVRAEALTAGLVRLFGEQTAHYQAQQAAQLAAQHAAQAKDHALAQEQAAAESLITSREMRLDAMGRLLGSIRRIDQADSLTGILGALARGAAAETSRVAILLVDGYMFRSWGHFGFEDGTGPIEMPIGASGTLAAAVALKQTSFVPPVIEGRESAVPAFMRVPAGHTGLVVPLSVGGEVVAVLYADDLSRSLELEDAPLWTEELELLARHASIRLENVTSARTVEVLARTD